MMVVRMLSQYNQIPYPPAGQPTTWRIIVSQRFSNWSKSSEPQQSSQPVDLALGGRTPRAFGLEGQLGLIAGAP